MSAEEMYLLPADAAAHLELSSSTLRRYAAAYEDVHAPLPRDRQGRRLWTLGALDRLSAARKVLESGSVQSIRAALEYLNHPSDLPERVTPDRDDLLIAMMEEIRFLRQEVSKIKDRQLEPGQDTQSAELTEQRQMNRYLLGELKRRSESNQPQRRGWWARTFGRG